MPAQRPLYKRFDNSVVYRPEPGRDLAAVDPVLAAQWDADRNGTLTPADVSYGSSAKVWWRCPDCGHGWRASVSSRASNGVGCPVCGELRHRAALRKPVVCVETGQVYESVGAAARAVGIASGSGISAVLAGRGQTAGGFHWRRAGKKGVAADVA